MGWNRLFGLVCYQIGPIDRVPDRGAVWREDISKFLFSLGVGVLNPLDKPFDWGTESEEARQWRIDKLKEAERLHNLGKIDESNAICDLVHNNMKDIVAADLRCVDKADFMIMYLDLDIFTCGSFNEQTHACLQRKPVIICCKQGKFKVPHWLWGICQHEMFFGNWIEVRAFLNHMAFSKSVEHFKRWRFFDFDKIYGKKS